MAHSERASAFTFRRSLIVAPSPRRRAVVLCIVVTALLALLVDPAPSAHAVSSGGTAPARFVQHIGAAPLPAIPLVSGNHLLDKRSGAIFVPRGVNWPSFEYACAQGWGYSRDSATAATATAIASWNANTVRLPLNQDCWLGTNGSPAGPGRTAAGYRAAVAAFVGLLNGAGLVVILDLHSFTTGGPNVAGQRAMPNAASATFFSSVATTFAANGSVMFDAYNEPYSRWNPATNSWAFLLTWNCWKSGGCQAPVEDDYTPTLSGKTYPVAGMASLVTAVRAAGATQPILLGGLDYSNDLRQWLAYRPDDGQLVASFHNYDGQRCSDVTCWNAEIARVAAVVPVITGEFGETDGTADLMNSYMTWADAHDVGYLAWAWWTLPDSDPRTLALLSNDGGAPRAPLGTALRSHLLALGDPVPPAPGTFVADGPDRLLDTRSAGGPVAAGATLAVPIAGRGTLPDTGMTAVTVNVTVTGASSSGYLTAYPSGSARPGTSNLNFSAGRTSANLVVVGVGTDGKVNLYNGSDGSIQVIVDVSGYYVAGTPAVAGAYRPLPSARLLDTRSSSGAVAAGGTVAFQVTSRAGVPSGAEGVALTVTAVAPQASGFVTAFADTRPPTSSLNFAAGRTVPNLVMLPVGTDGKVRLYNGSAGVTQLIADVSGYYLPGIPSAAGTFQPTGPVRVLDTRSHLGGSAAPGARQQISVQIAGLAGVPASGVTAVLMNVTAVAPTAGGYLTVFPTDTARPGTSNIGLVAGDTVANSVVVPLGVDGRVALYNGSAGTTPLLADVIGYFLAP